MINKFISQTLPKYGNLALFSAGVTMSFNNMKNDRLKNTFLSQQQELIDNTKKISSPTNENLKDQIKNVNPEIQEKIDNLISNVKDNLSEIGKETNVNEKLIAKTNDKLTELNSDINEIFSVNKNLFDNLNIKDIMENINHFLSDLNQEQLLAVTHISGFIFIIYCIIAIVLAIFGDKIILKLDLENRYPKLSKIIKLRRKIYEYNIIFNILLIFMVLVAIIYLNILILIH